jgi:hypothetical protein
MDFRRAALALVLLATLAGCGVGGTTAQCDLASTALTQGQLATAAELYARAQQSGEGSCADTGLDSVANRYASAFREAARGTALEVAADDAGAQAAYQSALALDQGNQPAMNGLTRLGVPQEQRITSLPLPAVPPYPQATVWTGWPIVLPTFLLAVAALAVALLFRRSAPAGGRGFGRLWKRGDDWVSGGRRKRRSDDEGPEEDEGYAADAAERDPAPRSDPEPRLGSPADEHRPESTPRPTTRPVTSEDARTDPITVVQPRSLDLGRSDDPQPGRERRGGRAPSSEAPADDEDPEPAPPVAPGALAVGTAGAVAGTAIGLTHSDEPAADTGSAARESAGTPPAEPRTTAAAAEIAPEPAPDPAPDPALATQGAEIGQLQRLLDRLLRADERPLPRRYFASGENVAGPAVGVTLAVCVVDLTGGEAEARRLLCVQRLVVGAVPGGNWAPANGAGGVEWAASVQADVERRAAGSVRDHDGRVWSTDPVPDDRGLLRLVDAGGPAWTALLRGEDPASGPLGRPSTAGASALQAALEGREVVVSPGPRPAGVRVIALVDALLVEGSLVNARVEAHDHEMAAVAAAESIEVALAAELVDLQKRGSSP